MPGLPSIGGNELSELLEIGAHGITAVLATWLGLLVLTRARRAAGAPVFAFVCLLLTVWSVAIIVQRVGADASIKPAVNLAEDLTAFLLPAATLHIALSIAIEGRWSTTATALLVAGYGLGLAAGAQAALDPSHPIGFSAPAFAPFGLPEFAVAWTFAIARASLFGAGIVYLSRGLLDAGPDVARRRQLRFALATVVLGVIGGMARILPEEIGGPRWVGVSLVAIAVVMATYAILAQHVFVAADVAGRAVRGSVVAGLGVVAYVALLIGGEQLVGSALGIDFPLVTTLAIVVTLVLFDPISDRLQGLLAGSPRAAAEERLQQALGADPMLAQAPDRAVEPALARLVRTFGLAGAEVRGSDGTIRARVGAVDGEDPLALRFDLAASGADGIATFGRKLNGLSFTAADLDALRLATSYLGSSLRLAERQRQGASILAELREEGAAVLSKGSALTEVLADAGIPAAGLRVHALGSLRAELDGQPLHRWGGAKAGARQAEAIFAFLLDRGDRGASKDEIVELVWPDVDLDRADVAFHRTMLGLRSALDPGRRARSPEGPIGFHNDRYRLAPSAVAWSDVDEFDALVRQAGSAPHAEAGMELLERARALYRGDYLDDCPYYGDSVHVEDRRTDLRRRYVDVLAELGERYADRGDRTAAANLLRQAQAVADEEMPRISEALGRLTAAQPADLA